MDTKNADSLRLEDIYALNLLRPLITGYPYTPFTGASFRPFWLAYIIIDIVLNSRNNIIEFGYGVSTIIIGRLIKKNNLKANLISIEHDANWYCNAKFYKTRKISDVVNLRLCHI